MHSAIEAFKSTSSRERIPHIITTNVEHCATELPLKNWTSKGEIGKKTACETFIEQLTTLNYPEVTFVEVALNGRVEPEKVMREVRDNTVLITIIRANNETGIIQVRV